MTEQTGNNTLLRVDQVGVVFSVARAGSWPWQSPDRLTAVNDISFEIEAGTTLGIVGESGCGKSSLARAIMGLNPIARGSVFFAGQQIDYSDRQSMHFLHTNAQMIFQDPVSSLNPRMTVGEIIEEPLKVFFPELSSQQRHQKIHDILDRVGMVAASINRYPHEFSGGQCQRIGIARAIVAGPKLLVCDEPVSALDVSVQVQIIKLLQQLQSEMDLTLIFIAHDLGVVKHVSDHVLVMYLGQAMELSRTDELIKQPSHPYSRALLSAVPVPDPELQYKPQLLEGELPSPLKVPEGCVFCTRCPLATDTCRDERPVFSSHKQVACHTPL